MEKYTKEKLINAVDSSTSVAGVLRYLGLKEAGGTHTYISTKLKKLDIDTSHFTGQGHYKGKSAGNRKTAKDILVHTTRRQKSEQLRRALIESGIEYKCSECSTSWWNSKELTLQVDHIDGDWTNNSLENLRFLCPNCHSQTKTYCKRK